MKDVYQRLAQIDAGVALDAATGKGEFINVIKSDFRSYAQIIGVDSSEKSVSYAQKVFPENDIEIYRMNLEELAFENEHFDTVTIANSIHHLENPDKVFVELLRVLKPGGLFLVSEMYRDGEQTEAQQTHIMMHHWLSSIDRLFGISHRETYTRDDIHKMIKKLALKKCESFDYYLPVDNPKMNRNCETLLNNCKDGIKRLEASEASSELINKGKELIERINNIGCAGASRVMILGYKS